MFLFIVELVPVFISQPSNPSTVLEGQNLTLHWSYNLDGQSNEIARISNVTGGSGTTVVRKSGSSDAIVSAGYENQFLASISDTEAILTILVVPRSGSGEKYSLVILTTNNILNSVIVEISVLCEYKSWLLRSFYFSRYTRLTVLGVKKVQISCFSFVW